MATGRGSALGHHYVHALIECEAEQPYCGAFSVEMELEQMRWYQTPVEDELPPEEYLERAERFHRVAVELPPAIGVRFEAMAADALAIANQKSLERADLI